MTTNGIWATFEARLGDDPELKEVSGTPVCNVRLAATERRQNKQTGQWEDGPTTWVRGAVWGPMAFNVAQSLAKGMLVNVTGILSERKWQNEQSSGSQLELRVETISPSLRFASAQVVPNERGGNRGPQQPPAEQWAPGQASSAPWQNGGPAPQVTMPQGMAQGVPQQQQPQQPAQQFRGPQPGQPGPQQNQQWRTPAYQGSTNPDDDVPF